MIQKLLVGNSGWIIVDTRTSVSELAGHGADYSQLEAIELILQRTKNTPKVGYKSLDVLRCIYIPLVNVLVYVLGLGLEQLDSGGFLPQRRKLERNIERSTIGVHPTVGKRVALV